MAKSGVEEVIFLTYLEEVTERFEHTVKEFSDNTTNFCQNNTFMSERKIEELANSGPSKSLLKKDRQLPLQSAKIYLQVEPNRKSLVLLRPSDYHPQSTTHRHSGASIIMAFLEKNCTQELGLFARCFKTGVAGSKDYILSQFGCT